MLFLISPYSLLCFSPSVSCCLCMLCVVLSVSVCVSAPPRSQWPHITSAWCRCRAKRFGRRADIIAALLWRTVSHRSDRVQRSLDNHKRQRQGFLDNNQEARGLHRAPAPCQHPYCSLHFYELDVTKQQVVIYRPSLCPGAHSCSYWRIETVQKNGGMWRFLGALVPEIKLLFLTDSFRWLT